MNCRTPPMIHQHPPTRPRNPAREREIMDAAVRAAHRYDDAGISTYADERALPMGVRTGQDWRGVHGKEELGDFRNYLVWDTEEYWDAYMAGDVEAGERVAENLTALGQLVNLWAGLYGP